MVVKSWHQSGLGIGKYCRQRCLTENTFRRWLKQIAGEQAASNLAEYQAELRREKHGKERAKQQPTRQRHVIWFDHRRSQSRCSSVLADACGGDELEWAGRSSVRRRTEAVVLCT